VKLGLGTAQFGLNYGISNKKGQCSQPEVRKILNLAAEQNIQVLDTASSYGNSENVIGESLWENHPFRIVTKIPKFSSLDNVTLKLRKNFKQSLSKLRQDYIYGLLDHNADNLLSVKGKELWKVMQQLKQDGMVNKIGASVYTPEQVDSVVDNYAIDIIQVPINIFDQRLLQNGYLSKIKRRGIEIHARSVFLQGLLLMEASSIPDSMAEIRDCVRRFHTDCYSRGYTSLHIALDFMLQQKDIDVILVGVCSYYELRDISNIINLNITKYDYEKYALNDECLINPSLWGKKI
jgi:aryl-alcohol dehydrogenase-like predicted oxidoreductase